MGRADEGDVSMDSRPLPVGRLCSDLYAKYVRRPAILVGGGPSAPQQLEQLKHLLDEAIVLSANGHAWSLGLGAHYIVCKDHQHTETKQLMEPALRAFRTPIIARHHWADYRLPRWPIQGNSGMMALGVAALMGCAPIFPIGFDCYQGATYFHTPDEKNVSQGIRDSAWRSRYMRLGAKLATADIRLLGPRSPLDAAFKRHDSREALKDWCIPPVLQIYRDMQTYYGRAKRDFPLKHEPSVQVPEGYVFPMDREEFGHYQRSDSVDLVDNAV